MLVVGERSLHLREDQGEKMYEIDDNIRNEINAYLGKYYTPPVIIDEAGLFNAETTFKEGKTDGKRALVSSLEELVGSVGETFCEMLFRKIEEKGLTDSEVYKKADIDRKLFSKIRSNPAYHPQKNTVIALALALELPIDEFKDMLARAEYALSPSSKSDLIVKYFVEHKVYDLMTINFTLDEYGQEVIR